MVNVKLAVAIVASLPDLSDKDAAYWLDHPEKLARALEMALTLTQPALSPSSYTVTVDYGKTVLDRFQSTGKGKKPVEVTMLELDLGISSEAAIQEMDRLDYRPATAQELAPLEHFDGLPDGFCVALGSTWRDPYGDLDVLCLSGIGSRRRLSLVRFGDVWVPGSRFAAVRKSADSADK